MEQILHKYIDVRGLKIHVAEIGTGDTVVVFLHGFPEIWYSWRHQMIAVANAGFRAIAPDCRGYGLSEQPLEPEKATFKDLVDDLYAMLDLLNIPKVFLVGKDFGVLSASHFALLYPERVSGLITLGLPFTLAGPGLIPRGLIPSGFYVFRWQEPGRAEADFGRFDIRTVIRNIYILFSGSELQIARDDQEIMDLVDPSTPLPAWFTEEDLTNYANLYEKSGFRTALQVPYRKLSEGYGVTDLKVKVPVLFIQAGKDYCLKLPRMEYYINGPLKDYVPDLEIKTLPEGSHFVQEQFPDEVNLLIISFLNKHTDQVPY